MELCLASTSPARLALLRAAGVEPVVEHSHVDEEAAVAAAARDHEVGAAEMVLLLARLKAEAVAGRLSAQGPADRLIVGGDSAFELDGRIYGKPHLAELASERWRAQRGRTGVLHSGHWLIDCRTEDWVGIGAVAAAEVTFVDDMSDAEIDAYVASGEPLEVAGAFTIDSLGGPFIERITGDPSTVVGLSLSTLRRLVTSTGVAWTELWNR
jgi:septum formation protein